MEESTSKTISCYQLREEPGYPAMLDIQLTTGERYGLPYSYLIWVKYDPEKGVLLRFSSYLVLVKGRNLQQLYHGLLQQRVEWIAAEDPRYDDGPESGVFIHEIDVRVPDKKSASGDS